MLFRPNTMFEITSTLYGASEIGQFYSGTDNIAMMELTGAAATLAPDPSAGALTAATGAAPSGRAIPRAGLPNADRILLDVPRDFFFPMLNVLTGADAVAADILEVRDGDGEGKFAQVVVLPTASGCELQPLPDPEGLEQGGADSTARQVHVSTDKAEGCCGSKRRNPPPPPPGFRPRPCGGRRGVVPPAQKWVPALFISRPPSPPHCSATACARKTLLLPRCVRADNRPRGYTVGSRSDSAFSTACSLPANLHRLPFPFLLPLGSCSPVALGGWLY